MTEYSGSVEKFLSRATTVDPPTDPLTIIEMEYIVENSINGEKKRTDCHTHFKKMYPDAPLAKLSTDDFIMVIRLMNDPEGANTIFPREGITWKEYYQKKLDAVMKGGSKRKTHRRNKASKRNKRNTSNKHNKSQRGGTDRGSPSKRHSDEATISRSQLDALARANVERMEQARLARERQLRERQAGLDDLLHRPTGTPRRGPGALATLLGP